MRKLILAVFAILFTANISIADDCIMVQELQVEFKNDSTTYVDKELETNKILEFKNFIQKTDLYVLIEGHTNSISTATHNLDLSTRRANKVMNDLIVAGMDSSRVRSMGFGETISLYDNKTEIGLNKNRRVFAEVFNTAEDLDQYIKEQKAKIEPILLQEQ
jgi:OOP family OmpA-OmpF porin